MPRETGSVLQKPMSVLETAQVELKKGKGSRHVAISQRAACLINMQFIKRRADSLPQNLEKSVELRGQGCCHWGTSLDATMLLLPAVLWEERQADLKWGLGTKSNATMSHIYSCHRHLFHMKIHSSYDPCSTLPSYHLGCGKTFGQNFISVSHRQITRSQQ